VDHLSVPQSNKHNTSLKKIPQTNTLAYFGLLLVTKKTSFIVLAPEELLGGAGWCLSGLQFSGLGAFQVFLPHAAQFGYLGLQVLQGQVGLGLAELDCGKLLLRQGEVTFFSLSLILSQFKLTSFLRLVVAV